MCCTKDWIQSPPPKEGSREQKPHPSRRSKVRVQRLITRRRYEATTTTMAGEEDMELKNLKLYLENRSILEENEKLRQKALRLRQENIALLAEFQKKSSFS